ncbi:MAG: HAMP domain-containing histidine kinase [Bacteroidales bacterium]|nr:HAMP domain-containing histidine kinase [Bacteroidales bacterium]
MAYNRRFSSTLSKSILFFSAFILCALTLWYTNWMVNDLEADEHGKVELWAKATNMIAADSPDESDVIDLLLQIIHSNNTIPVIVTDSAENVISVRNLSENDTILSSKEIASALAKLKVNGQRIDIPVSNGQFQHLYYSDSRVIRRLSFFPFVELALVALFIIFAYIVFSSIKRSEEDKVWIGLARETAHQLGTPITALIGWTDLLESGDIDNRTASAEIKNDAERLRNIADRFSKIGSQPEMLETPLSETIASTAEYLRSRLPKRIKLVCNLEADSIPIRHNPVLIGWAIENLCRNATDATEGDGTITIRSYAEGEHMIIDVTDTGKGMPHNIARNIFKPGYTTKKRGWGIGLTLTRRIINEYHNGRIFVANTEPNIGTTIRIVLN